MDQIQKTSMEIKFPVPWGHIAAKVYGPLKEKKILMVHGILDNAGSFDRLVELLPQEYQYVNVDLPGHGLSSPFSYGTPLHFFDYVYSISLVLNALKWKTCIYIGHSFGAQIGIHFNILYPGRFEKIIAIDGFLSSPVENVVSHIQDKYNLDAYSKNSKTLYTKDEIIYALKFKRQETLKLDAAEAMFERAVTKVNNLYKYNRDTRLRFMVKPYFTIEEQEKFFIKYATKTLIIIADNSSHININLKLLKIILNVSDKNKISVIFVNGNHDVHNNYPERIAFHICKFLNTNDLQSKL
ncbi:serine hydrolase-like protein [Apis florea]|uniref:serine hydrolase-like protein n=1 Tax=Apis florea TaxID=7463 RepID=UPI0006291DB7|nr:serine hydrolase-like protein [Apis florea]